jgi:hypothetical protein
MSQKIQVVKKQNCDNTHPRLLVVTPLLPGHTLSKQTKRTIKNNLLPLVWITSEGDNNIPTNLELGLNWYKENHEEIPYYFMLDRDIELGKHCLDRLYDAITGAPDYIAFAYASFKYRGHINADFPARPYDINALVQHNYISSNSMYKTAITEQVGLVKEDMYKRLLDWAFFLKLFYNEYFGVPVPTAEFVAHSTEKDISARSPEDYQQKRKLVIENFVMPIYRKLNG